MRFGDRKDAKEQRLELCYYWPHGGGKVVRGERGIKVHLILR
jgi:hypothetical protein